MLIIFTKPYASSVCLQISTLNFTENFEPKISQNPFDRVGSEYTKKCLSVCFSGPRVKLFVKLRYTTG